MRDMATRHKISRFFGGWNIPAPCSRSAGSHQYEAVLAEGKDRQDGFRGVDRDTSAGVVRYLGIGPLGARGSQAEVEWR